MSTFAPTYMNDTNKGKAKIFSSWLCTTMFLILTFCNNSTGFNLIPMRRYLSADTTPVIKNEPPAIRQKPPTKSGKPTSADPTLSGKSMSAEKNDTIINSKNNIKELKINKDGIIIKTN